MSADANSDDEDESSGAAGGFSIPSGSAPPAAGTVDQNALTCDPKNPLLPRNESEEGKGRFALLVAFAGFGATVGALVFSRMVTLLGQNEFASSLPRALQDQALLAASVLIFVVSVFCVFGLGKAEHAMPVLNDLVFERMRSSWTDVDRKR